MGKNDSWDIRVWWFGLDFSHAGFLTCVIPRLAVTAFVWDVDDVVGYLDGVVEVGFDFSTGPFGDGEVELTAKGVVDGVDWLDD